MEKDGYDTRMDSQWWIFDKWRYGESFEHKDPLKRGLNDNYGYLMAMGGMYLCFPGNWIITFIHLCSAIGHMCLFSYTTYLNLNNLAMASECIHFVVFLFCTSCMMVNGIIFRSKMDYIMRILGEDVYDYKNTLDENTTNAVNIMKAETKYRKKILTHMFVVLVMMACCSISILRPIGLYLSQSVDYNTDDYINRYTPVVSWYPLDHRVLFYNVICNIYQYLVIYTVPCIVFGNDLTFLYVSEEIILQLKKLGLGLENTFERSKHLMKLNNGKDIHACLDECMAHSIRHHIAIVRLFNHFKDYYFYILFILLIAEAMMVCLGCVLFTSKDVSTFTITTFFLMVAAELSHIFIICWYGEQIKHMASSISESMYNSDWFTHSNFMRIHMLMVIQKGLKPLSLKAGGLIEASLETFANVLSSSYSYFNLLNAVK